MSIEPMESMLYACAHAEEFPAQASLRMRGELEAEPVAVVDGRPPLETVCSLNRLARLRGVELGMTKLEAESVAGLRLVARSAECEAAARAVFLECAAHFSPRIEDASQGTSCACVLDIAGTERLFGAPRMLAQRLRAAYSTAGFRVSVAVSANFDAARLKAADSRGITVIGNRQEATALAKLPLAALDLPDEQAETFAVWGIRTLGELAALPEVDLVTRLGPRATEWRDLARGKLPHTFLPIETQFRLEEFCDFETPVDRSESLLFAGARMIDCLVARASARALSLASLTVNMKLEGECAYLRTIIRPAIPTTDRKFLLKLLLLEIAAHPPHAAVVSITLRAEAGQSSKVQLGLFMPQTPEPSRLDVTIARLKAIAGEDRVGSPMLEDSHRPGNFRMESFRVSAQSHEAEWNRPRMALRRMRPPVAVGVQLRSLKPVIFRDDERIFKVSMAYGPWKTSGNWWSTDGWNTEEWDVLAETVSGSSVACLLVRDCQRNEWRLEALYD